MRPVLALLLTVALLSGCGEGDPPASGPSKEEMREALAGAPAPLARLHAQSSELLPGGPTAFRARLRELKGYPVVVNKWASWCEPCRAEFPHFQSQATKRGKRIAFLGVDGNDNDGDAREFLEKFPVPFPSYVDGDLKIAAVLKAVQAFPSTAFFDRRGKLAYVKQGGYATEQKLAEDIDRYAR